MTPETPLPESGVPTVAHPFKPRGEWWTLCHHCGLGEAAHVTTTLEGGQQ